MIYLKEAPIVRVSGVTMVTTLSENRRGMERKFCYVYKITITAKRMNFFA